MAKKNFASIEFQKYYNGPVLLVKTIFRHCNCLLSSVASDGKDGHGLRLEKVGPASRSNTIPAKYHPKNYDG